MKKYRIRKNCYLTVKSPGDYNMYIFYRNKRRDVAT